MVLIVLGGLFAAVAAWVVGPSSSIKAPGKPGKLAFAAAEGKFLARFMPEMPRPAQRIP